MLQLPLVVSATSITILLLSGCAAGTPDPAAAPTDPSEPSDPSAALPRTPTGEALVKYMTDSPKKFVMSPREGRPGLSNYHVSVDGVDAWPPSGESCESVTQCCEDIVSDDGRKHIALACMFAVVREPTCNEALTTVTTILDEQNLSHPSSCTK